MTLRDEIAADAQAAWFDTDGLAQTVVYTPDGARPTPGAPVSVPAVLVYGGNLEAQGRFLAEEMTAKVRQADVAAPQAGDTLAVGAAVWTVQRVTNGDGLGLAWELACTKGVRAGARGR